MRGDDTYLSGFNEPEKNSTETFRWTGGAAELRLPNLSSRYQELRIHAHGWRPAGVASPVVQLDLAGRPWASIQTQRDLRIYHVLLPRDATSPTIDVGFMTPVYSTPNDDRELGFGLDWLELHELDRSAGPTSGSSAARRYCWRWRCCCWGCWRCRGAGRWQRVRYWRQR